METPNILFIQADQLKPQVLRSYGGPADTPHLDALGAEPVWEHRPSDATTPWLLRGEGLYNDWAWQGIE